MVSVEAIWWKKTTFHEEVRETKLVALILIKFKTALVSSVWLLVFEIWRFPIFVKFDDKILQVLLASKNLSRLSKPIFQSFF